MDRLSKFLIGLSIVFSLSPAHAQDRYINIGTGGVTGTYYPLGNNICRLVNRNSALRCSVEATGGSVYNVNRLQAKTMDFGLVQSDVQAEAVLGQGNFKQPVHMLRSVFSLHAEPVHLMVRKQANIQRFQDLKEKRVNIGNAGSGQRSLMNLMMRQAGWTKSTFKLASELKSSEQAQALCDNKIDAAFWTAGIGNGSTQSAAAACPIDLVNMDDEISQAILAAHPALSKAIIPANTYAGISQDITTFGPRGTLVTRADTDEEVVYQLVKSIFENFETFKKIYPTFADLEPQQMISTGLVAPLHKGAEKYYKEQGWL
ncbi:TAXI family TRAP transporter solute-binding subunit [Pseudomonas sp. F1_0610]|uniref:TAXI family TRAP transporter solute-binding subunit n=1 Tax=Pseudomonas sp. F1_0610 TaxID=3114284 RepID=UPI0039C00A97